MADRQCEGCGGSIPSRMSRQRDEQGRLVCDSCKTNPQPKWSSNHTALSVVDQQEMRRREAEAITAIVKVRRAKTSGLSVVAHDSGDNAIINHCPFCGSGGVVGRSDGTASCEFCHSAFTVQVQPAHPFMPQTVDGQPMNPPDMPAGQESEISGPQDLTVKETSDDVAADPLGDADPSAPPPSGRPGAPSAEEDPKKPGGGNQPPWLKGSASRTAADDGWQVEYNSYREPIWKKRVGNVVATLWEVASRKGKYQWSAHTEPDFYDVGGGEDWYDSKEEAQADAEAALAPYGRPTLGAFRTTEGATLDADDYMARLALAHADDRDAVLDVVRIRHTAKAAVQTSDPNSREEHPYPDMGDYVVKADAIRQFIRAGLYSTYAEASEALGDRLHVDGIQSNLTTRQKVEEVMGKQGRTATKMVDCPECRGAGERDTGRTESDTNAPITEYCPHCDGMGQVDLDSPENWDLREPPYEAAKRA